jgi:hypothetical protein
MSGDGEGARQWQLKLSVRVEESVRELGREGRRCGGGRGSSGVYIGAEGGPGMQQRVATDDS